MEDIIISHLLWFSISQYILVPPSPSSLYSVGSLAVLGSISITSELVINPFLDYSQPAGFPPSPIWPSYQHPSGYFILGSPLSRRVSGSIVLNVTHLNVYFYGLWGLSKVDTIQYIYLNFLPLSRNPFVSEFLKYILHIQRIVTIPCRISSPLSRHLNLIHCMQPIIHEAFLNVDFQSLLMSAFSNLLLQLYSVT